MTVTKDKTLDETRISVRIRGATWEKAKMQAIKDKTTLQEVIDSAVNSYIK